MDILELAKNLPVPGVDELPPRVEMTDKDRRKAKEARKEAGSFLKSKNDTEERVKYALGKLCGMRLKKDGDWKVSAGGHRFWAKKVADFTGSTPGNDGNYHTHVEVKGISPGKTFAFIRLDKPGKNGQPSQFEKLNESWKHGNLVFLALGWWIAPAGSEHAIVKKGKRNITKWHKDTLELEIALIPWGRWVQHVESTKRRSITHSVLMDKFQDCLIVKVGRPWEFFGEHWWYRRFENSPLFGGALVVQEA